MTKPLCISFILLLAGCSSTPSEKDKSNTTPETLWIPPAPGTIVAADSMKVTGDALNNAYFSVRLSVGEGNIGKKNKGFRYDVHATYGKAVADGIIIMPFGGEHLKPLLRRGDGYNYIIGFIPAINGDTTFHEYYRIGGDKEFIKIVPLKGYTINETPGIGQ